MRRLELTEIARADLQSIRRYSNRKWGAERTGDYMAALASFMNKLVDGTALSRDRNDVRPGLRLAPSGRHCVFFEELRLRQQSKSGRVSPNGCIRSLGARTRTMIGTTVLHYKIIEKLGIGGMGVV